MGFRTLRKQQLGTRSISYTAECLPLKVRIRPATLHQNGLASLYPASARAHTYMTLSDKVREAKDLIDQSAGETTIGIHI